MWVFRAVSPAHVLVMIRGHGKRPPKFGPSRAKQSRISGRYRGPTKNRYREARKGRRALAGGKHDFGPLHPIAIRNTGWSFPSPFTGTTASPGLTRPQQDAILTRHGSEIGIPSYSVQRLGDIKEGASCADEAPSVCLDPDQCKPRNYGNTQSNSAAWYLIGFCPPPPHTAERRRS